MGPTGNMQSPFDEFGRDYSEATVTDPSPYVAPLETEGAILRFVPPPGEPDLFNKIRETVPDGHFNVWSWSTATTPQYYTSTVQHATPSSLAITVSGRGGTFIARIPVEWNNENAWSGLACFKRTDMGGIDLDWLAIGCSVCILPYPQGVGFLRHVCDFYLAVGFKLLTPNGASQFFYPGAKSLSIVQGGELSNEVGSPFPSVGWVPLGESSPGSTISAAGFYTNRPGRPIIPVSADNLSPDVQLPIIGGVGQAYMEGTVLTVESPYQPFGNLFNVPAPVTNIQQHTGFSISFDQWGSDSDGRSGWFQYAYSESFSFNSSGGSVFGSSSSNSGTLPPYPEQWAIASGEAVELTLDDISWSTEVSVATGSYTDISGIEHSWPDLLRLDISVTYTGRISGSGPYSYWWGGVPGGCNVIPPSPLSPGVNGGGWASMLGSIIPAGDQVPGTLKVLVDEIVPSSVPGTYAYPIMQVPCGPDTFLVAYPPTAS